jgi:hypothetical protein
MKLLFERGDAESRRKTRRNTSIVFTVFFSVSPRLRVKGQTPMSRATLRIQRISPELHFEGEESMNFDTEIRRHREIQKEFSLRLPPRLRASASKSRSR